MLKYYIKNFAEVVMPNKDTDDFWDISKLIPQKKRQSPPRFDTGAVEITDSGANTAASESGAADASARAIPRGRAEGDGVDSYREYDASLTFVKKVRVYSCPAAYRYYAEFESTMHKYLRLTVKEAQREPFFSYVPQYSQLSQKRLAWYLYWRSHCRRREYLPTDFSYVLLYVYELINFDNPRHPDRIAEELCALWAAYRGEFSQLDRYLPDWLCDYCLVHGCRPPYDTLGEFFGAVIKNATLKEFYLGEDGASANAYVRALVSEPSVYDYRKSKYYTEETRDLYELHLPAAIAQGFEIDASGICDKLTGTELCTLKKDIFVGALCTWKAKRTLEIEYYPVYRPSALRGEVSLAVKHAENKLRAVLGLRSGLSDGGLSPLVRERIDAYFKREFPDIDGRPPKKNAEPEYMAFYDSVGQGLEYSRALDIENESWTLARLMGEAFDDDEADGELETTSGTEAVKNSAEPISDTAVKVGGAPMSFSFPLDADVSDEEGFESLRSSLDALELELVGLLLRADHSGAQRACANASKYISAVCEHVNELALETISDILIESDGERYVILSDYENEVKRWYK